jgi:hypothetical protein
VRSVEVGRGRGVERCEDPNVYLCRLVSGREETGASTHRAVQMRPRRAAVTFAARPSLTRRSCSMLCCAARAQ